MMEATERATASVNWDKYQEDVFTFLNEEPGNLVVDARAGSGKSTTLIECLYRITQTRGGMLVTSFGKDQVEDLKKKDPPWTADTFTLNSIGHRILTQHFGKLDVREERVLLLLDEIMHLDPGTATGAEISDLRYRVKQAVDLARTHLATSHEEYVNLCDEFSIDIGMPQRIADALGRDLRCKPYDSFCVLIDRVLQACKHVDDFIDYNDQIYLPIVLGLPFDTYGTVFVDEIQDVNPAQMEMIARSMSPGGRFVGIGDDRQAIYRWRGAGVGTSPIIKRFKAKVLPLVYSYRCPQAIVREAKKIVSDIRPAPEAPKGLVERIPELLLSQKVKPGDVILSRSNAVAISTFLSLIKDGIPCSLQGRKQTGAALMRFINKSKATTAEELLAYTSTWAKGEITRKEKKGKSAGSMDAVLDRVLCIRAICEGVSTIEEVKQSAMNLLLSPEGSRVTISTVHRAKGKEWNRVFLMDRSFPVTTAFWRDFDLSQRDISRRASKVLAKNREEANIRYVAITRARAELYFVVPESEMANERRERREKKTGAGEGGRFRAIVDEIFGTEGAK